jgi:hypothetical protein
MPTILYPVHEVRLERQQESASHGRALAIVQNGICCQAIPVRLHTTLLTLDNPYDWLVGRPLHEVLGAGFVVVSERACWEDAAGHLYGYDAHRRCYEPETDAPEVSAMPSETPSPSLFCDEVIIAAQPREYGLRYR